MAAPRPLIIDCDPGHDDALALLMALASPDEFDILGITAVAALIGAGGLGVFIFQGLGQSAVDLILLGAIPIILLAVFSDFLIHASILAVKPKGLR